ncbi:GNAT family N-acetyltransferase [Cohnella yongneupensis]|uniref:GNAT family N-acetyltransferase n=1 Tax=Cohnella yongneupensis TaxID=425006 RepID=A0ABW0R150_9BACL
MLEAIPIEDKEAAEEVWALQHAAYRVEASLIGVAELPPLRDTIESLRASNERFYGLREADGELVGVISYEIGREGRHAICRLMVSPPFFRQGIGSSLLHGLLRCFPSVRWSVTAEIRNLPALALYEKAGFVRKRTLQPAPGITLIELELEAM